MTAADLRARAAERRRVGWEISDAMTPTEMTNIAAELDRLRDCLGSIRAHLVGQDSALAVAIRATCNSGLRETND